jgi:hypothetical protein
MKALRVIGLVLVAGLTLEVAARFDDWVRYGANPLGRYDLEEVFHTAEFGKQGKPEARFKKWKMNSLGYRSGELRKHDVTVLAFGASETFGLFETEGNEYPQILEKLLRSSGRAFGVQNIAIPGMRIGRSPYLEHAIQTTQARVVILYPSPITYFGIGKPLCGTKTSSVMGQAQRGPMFRMTGKANEVFRKHLPEAVQTAIRKLAASRASSEIKRASWSAADQEAYKHDIQCLLSRITALGAVPILVTHGTIFGDRFQLDSPATLQAWSRFYPELEPKGFSVIEQEGNETVREVASLRGIQILDFARIVPPGKEYFADFVHFNDKGASLMAQSLVPLVIRASE